MNQWNRFVFNMFYTRFSTSDKFVHALGCFAAVLALHTLGMSLLLSGILVTLGGVANEFIDWKGEGMCFDSYDIVANLFGIAVAIIVAIV